MTDLGRFPLLGHYLRVLVLVTCGINVGAVLLSHYTALSIPAGTLAMIPPVLAALSVGRLWVRLVAEAPDGREAWIWSAVAALGYLLVQLLFLPLAMIQVEVTPTILQTTVTLLVGVTVLVVPLHRLFLALGARLTLQRG